jgi:hypothetical protein
MIDAPQPADRLERGKQRTRAALMRARRDSSPTRHTTSAAAHYRVSTT